MQMRCERKLPGEQSRQNSQRVREGIRLSPLTASKVVLRVGTTRTEMAHPSTRSPLLELGEEREVEDETAVEEVLITARQARDSCGIRIACRSASQWRASVCQPPTPPHPSIAQWAPYSHPTLLPARPHPGILCPLVKETNQRTPGPQRPRVIRQDSLIFSELLPADED
ncbi:hypothetical protein J4Q44_G00351820 [Coregonus suidteri]|uniref:Uncharacterized protein n=1 Tax=Coregonus suidteri TaxID=861788 RepID=A0AAN8QLS0_9TELE